MTWIRLERYYEGGEEYEVHVRADTGSRDDIAAKLEAGL